MVISSWQLWFFVLGSFILVGLFGWLYSRKLELRLAFMAATIPISCSHLKVCFIDGVTKLNWVSSTSLGWPETIVLSIFIIGALKR